jgi:hypothetical protein
MPKIVGGHRPAMTAIVANPNDTAPTRLSATAFTMLRTTCVATMLNAGHATNALPRATANVNCFIFPGVAPVT